VPAAGTTGALAGVGIVDAGVLGEEVANVVDAARVVDGVVLVAAASGVSAVVVDAGSGVDAGPPPRDGACRSVTDVCLEPSPVPAAMAEVDRCAPCAVEDEVTSHDPETTAATAAHATAARVRPSPTADAPIAPLRSRNHTTAARPRRR
jgi:hypothetical protein